MAAATYTKSDELHPQAGDMAHANGSLRLFRLILRAIFKLLFRVRVVSLENVPSKPVIICANHLGWVDAFLVLLFLPVEPRIYVLGERQVAHISKARNIMISWLQIMVALDRDKPREALRVMSDILKGGGSLLIFPEGQLGKVEGELLPLQQGAPHLSLHTGIPILPIGMTGPHELWLRRTLTVRVGKPIDPAQFTGDLRTKLNVLTWQLDCDMRALLPGEKYKGSVPLRDRVRLLNRWLTELL